MDDGFACRHDLLVLGSDALFFFGLVCVLARASLFSFTKAVQSSSGFFLSSKGIEFEVVSLSIRLLVVNSMGKSKEKITAQKEKIKELQKVSCQKGAEIVNLKKRFVKMESEKYNFQNLCQSLRQENLQLKKQVEHFDDKYQVLLKKVYID